MARNPAVLVSLIADWDGKDLDKGIKELENARAATQTMSDKVGAFGSKMQSVGQQVGKVGGSLTKAVTLPLVGVGAALIGFAKEAEQATISNRKLGAVLDSMGYPQAATRVSDYAESLERTLAVDADVIRATQTKLATFKNLTATVNESGGAFDRATMAALDLAAAGFGSAETNAVQLGKALQDPIKGITALGRAGVTFTEQEKEKIKALVESGDMLAAQNMVLGAIETQVGGTAQAGASGFERIRLSLMQVAEAIGMAVLPLINQLSDFVSNTLVPTIVPKIERMVASFNALDPEMKKIILAAAGVAAALGPVLIIAGKLISGIGSIVTVFSGFTIAGSLLAIKIIAIVAAVAAVVIAFKMMWDRSEALRKAVGTLIETVKNIAKTLVGDLVAAFRSVNGEAGSVRSIFDRVAKVAGDVLGAALNILTNYWKILANGIRVVIKVFEVQFKIITMVANLIRGALIAAIDIIMNRLGPVSTQLRGFANGIKNGFTIVVNAVRGLFQNLGPALESFINFGIDAVNGLIRQYNKLAEVLPGVSKATEIARFEFSKFGGAADTAAKSSTQLANEANAARYTAMAGVTDWSAYTSALDDTGTEAVDLTNDLGSATDGAGKANEAAERYAKGLEAMKNKLAEWRKGLVKELDDAREEFFSFARQVSTAITGAINLGGAATGAADRVQAIADAEKNLAEARAEAAKADAGESAGARVIAAEAQLAQARSQGERLGLTFMEALNAQAAKAREFAAQIQTLISMGINKDSPLMQMIIGEGAESGSRIAAELIAGGATTIDQATELLTAVQGEADAIGLEAAEYFKGAGVSSALATVQGFDEQFGPGGPGRKQLMRIMDRLAEKAKRGVEIEVVVTRRTNEIVERIVSEIRRPAGIGVEGAGARGAIVRRPTVALIGEAGPEALLPLDRTRGNAPISDLRGGGVTINVTAGLGTDGAEVGRQIVDALKAYERRNGAVYASA